MRGQLTWAGKTDRERESHSEKPKDPETPPEQALEQDRGREDAVYRLSQTLDPSFRALRAGGGCTRAGGQLSAGSWDSGKHGLSLSWARGEGFAGLQGESWAWATLEPL